MAHDFVESCVIGAGVIGIAVARALNRRRPGSVCLIEQDPRFGTGASSRNSEVIHAGLYYPPASHKAHYCVRGRALLYRYCRDHGIPYRRTGKLIVAGEEERPALERLHANALASGVDGDDLQYLDRAGIRKLEPAVRAGHALFSRQSGIIDSHAFMQSLLQSALDQGLIYAPATRVLRISPESDAFLLHTAGRSDNSDRFSLRCRHLVNCAGLYAARLAATIEGLPSSAIPHVERIKGSYFSYRGESPFSRLIYPLPDASGRGLGIHATLDLADRLRFGPDVEAVEEIDYNVDEGRREHFADAIRRYFPALEAARLTPDYAGIRVRAEPADGEPFADFVIDNGVRHGLPGLVQFFGMESPGLTASLALAEDVAGTLRPDPVDQYC